MVPVQYLKHIEETDLYEMRVILGNNIFRIFSFFDKGRLVVLLNGFLKDRKNKIVKFDDHLVKEYGKRGTAKREKYERGFEAFKLGVMLQELRKQKNMTQQELAEKCGTTKTYISRIENDASDIRLSTLLRIIREGLGGQISISISN